MLRPAIIFLLVAFYSFGGTLFGQTPSSGRVSSLPYRSHYGSRKLQGTVSAIALKATEYLGDAVSLTVNKEEVFIPLDPDAPEYTYFISLPTPVTTPEISGSEDFTIYLINSGESPEILFEQYRAEQEDCEFEVSPIPQSEWRAGLDPPSYQRSFTEVEHVIVHHSAGSNTSTDYTQVVRDIYLYHTQVNGWSDIGYNYLIAQNGDLYAGRDPDGGAQDNVLGAHFCGSNSHTMGICLLGNYQTVEPTDNTWSTLKTLVAFKLKKEDLDPQGYIGHPLGTIGTIAGHRDGCSTECPGDHVYELLEGLRDTTSEALVSCGDLELALDFSFDPASIHVGESVSFANASSGYSTYQWLLEGADPAEADWPGSGSATYHTPGTYDVTIVGSASGISDTLTVAGAITVEELLIVDFRTDATQISPGDSVTFYNESSGYDAYMWILEGAEPDTAEWASSGSVVYLLDGDYDVTLLGFYDDGSDTLVRQNFIKVVGESTLSFSQNKETIQSGEVITFTNTSTGYDHYQWTLAGASPGTADWDNGGQAKYDLPGTFDIILRGYKDSGEVDTLKMQNAVSVEGDPVIFPNPVTDLGIFHIATTAAIEQVSVFNMEGKSTNLLLLEDGSFQIPNLGTGVYLIRIDTGEGSYTRRLLIE